MLCPRFFTRQGISKVEQENVYQKTLIISIRKRVLQKSQIKVSKSRHIWESSANMGDNRKDSLNPFGSSWKIFVHKSPAALFFLCFTDADDCAYGSHDCDVNADCNNIMGSFTCTCKPTYFGNGKNCTSFREFYACHICNYGINYCNKRTFLSLRL